METGASITCCGILKHHTGPTREPAKWLDEGRHSGRWVQSRRGGCVLCRFVVAEKTTRDNGTNARCRGGIADRRRYEETSHSRSYHTERAGGRLLDSDDGEVVGSMLRKGRIPDAQEDGKRLSRSLYPCAWTLGVVQRWLSSWDVSAKQTVPAAVSFRRTSKRLAAQKRRSKSVWSVTNDNPLYNCTPLRQRILLFNCSTSRLTPAKLL